VVAVAADRVGRGVVDRQGMGAACAKEL